MTAPTPWHTVAEVAEALRTSPSRILAHIHRGDLLAIDISEAPGKGRPRWRIPADALDRFASMRTNASPGPQSKTARRSRQKHEVEYV